MSKAIGITVSAKTMLVNVQGVFTGDSVRLTCTFDTATNITGQTLVLNIRDRPAGTVLVTKTATHSDEVNGVFFFDLTATDIGSTLGPGGFDFSVQRTDVGFEIDLADGQWPVMAA